MQVTQLFCSHFGKHIAKLEEKRDMATDAVIKQGRVPLLKTFNFSLSDT
jgi:hypothetical protein